MAEPVKAEIESPGIVRVTLADGRIIEVVFDEEGIPHRGRKITTLADGYVTEIVLPYIVHVVRKLHE